MPSEVILPRVDMDMTTGKISKWFVTAGTAVTKGQPLFEIETDKAAMEIEAPSSGLIRDLVEVSGRDIPVGSTVAWIDAEGEVPPAAGARALRDAPIQPLQEAAVTPPEPTRTPEPAPAATPSSPGADRFRATPMARRLAREHALDLGALHGTGPRGRVQADDVRRAAAQTAAPATLAPSVPAAPSPAQAGGLNLVRLREGAGVPTLLIHGFGADANGWRPFLSGSVSGKPVDALDLPGHGASRVGDVSSFETLVDAVEQALLGATPGAFDLVGHSLGGAVAAALAARGALQVRSLLLLAPAGLGPEINRDFLRGFLAATREGSLTPWLHELVADPATITPAFVRATLRSREESQLVQTQTHIAGAVFPDGTQAFSIRRDLAALTMPVRVVVGAADRIIPARHATGLPGMVATHVFPNVGHMPHLEAREAVAAILGDMTR